MTDELVVACAEMLANKLDPSSWEDNVIYDMEVMDEKQG